MQPRLFYFQPKLPARLVPTLSRHGPKFDELFGAPGIRESTVHFGCEILVRTVGVFQEGYLYEGLSLDDAVIQEAVGVAAQHIRSPETVDSLAALIA